MSFYNYLSFSGKPTVSLPEYKKKLASGEFLKAGSGSSSKTILSGLLEAIKNDPNGSKSPAPVHFDRTSVRVKTVEDLFFSTTINRHDPITGTEYPFVYRQKILPTNSYHDYSYAIDTFLAAAKKHKLVNPYSDLVEGYQTSISNETIFHYCYYYDLVSKVPIEILERYPTIIHQWMIMLYHFNAAGRTREAELIKESILYLVTTSRVFREEKDSAGNNALYYCSDLEIAAKYMEIYPEAVDNVNECGINLLLSSYTTRDIRLLLINCFPVLIYTSVPLEGNGGLDVQNKEYLWYGINDSFIVRFIIDMFNIDLLMATNGNSTIFNTSKCFDALLYLVNKVPQQDMVRYVRDHPKCYEVLFAPKIKVIGLYREADSVSLTPKMEYIRMDGHHHDPNWQTLKDKFRDYNENEVYG